MVHNYKDSSPICNFNNANETLKFDNTLVAKLERPGHELLSTETSFLHLVLTPGEVSAHS